MKISNRLVQTLFVIACLALSSATADAQKKRKKAPAQQGNAVLWERVNVRQQDLYFGPGGTEMIPDLSNITFISDQKGGSNLKYRIKDGAGRTWIAKIDKESQAETAAVRFLSAIGYKTEINYLVPRMTIPGKGTFTNVRLEARPDNVKRGKEWSWGKTPFEGTRPMQGLKLMMAFLNNWDTKNTNNDILKVGGEQQYIVSDLGATFGKTGWPVLWFVGRSKNNPKDYSAEKYISGVKKDRVKVNFHGRNQGRIRSGITTADARWLADLLSQLSDKQIRDAFRASNYKDSDINVLTRAVKSRINQLDRAGNNDRFALYR